MTDPTPAPEPAADDSLVRLQKLLAWGGFGSRRQCDDLIAAGRVTVDGAPAELGQRIDPDRASVAVDGEPVAVSADRRRPHPS